MAKKKTTKESNDNKIIDTVMNDTELINTPINTLAVKLNVNELYIYNVSPSTRKVCIEVVGGGDCYISPENRKFDIGDLCEVGTKKEFVDTNVLYMLSGARAKVKILECAGD